MSLGKAAPKVLCLIAISLIHLFTSLGETTYPESSDEHLFLGRRFVDFISDNQARPIVKKMFPNIATTAPRLPLLRILPSRRATYLTTSPFGEENGATAQFERDVADAARLMHNVYDPLATRFLEHFIYPVANTTIAATALRTKERKEKAKHQKDFQYILVTMPVAAPNEGYSRMIAYGQKKSMLRADQLALQSFLAGFWVAIYGHCCTVFASSFYTKGDMSSYAISKLAYGLLFPGAFVAVVYTGTELFTGNTVTMIMLVFHEGVSALRHLARVWSFSLVGNFIGAVFGAFFFSWLSETFKGGQAQQYLFAMSEGKLSRTFHANLILGVGCNSLVCLATWCVVVSDDGAGKILAMIYSIGVFALGGLEHIVANFYTLSAAYMCGYQVHSFGEIIWKNWLPVLIGNLIAGTLFTGMLWWYALHPAISDLAPYTKAELERELTKRQGAFDVELVEGDQRW